MTVHDRERVDQSGCGPDLPRPCRRNDASDSWPGSWGVFSCQCQWIVHLGRSRVTANPWHEQPTHFSQSGDINSGNHTPSSIPFSARQESKHIQDPSIARFAAHTPKPAGHNYVSYPVAERSVSPHTPRTPSSMPTSERPRAHQTAHTRRKSQSVQFAAGRIPRSNDCCLVGIIAVGVTDVC